jgi:ketosteroid isomerase-like protein
MGIQEDAAVVRRGYKAFNAGDVEGLLGLFADDAVYRVGGTSGLSGDKQGQQAIMGYFGELFSRSGGTVKVDLQDVIPGERHTVALQTAQAERNGKSMKQNGVLVFTLREGKVTEVSEFQEDTAVAADFWA